MEPPTRPRGLRIHDLIGLVVGYSLAALLTRAFWSRSRAISGVPGIALGLLFLWLGLAMSGPILLLLDRRDGSERSEGNGEGIGPRPSRTGRGRIRPGRLIGEAPAVAPVGRGPQSSTGREPRYTRAEVAWMVTGGYWIGLTLFVVPALSHETPWALVGLLQMVAALGLWAVLPGPGARAGGTTAWTHPTAVGLMLSWPIAWALMILLSRSF